MTNKLRSSLARPVDSYSKLALGSIALGLVLAILGSVLLVKSLDLGRTRYHAEFAQGAQLRAGDLVTIAGITVGNVEALRLSGDRVLVDFKVGNDIRLGRDTHAAIKLTTLLGSRYLQLSPAGGDVLHNATIPIEATTVPYNLQQALADATTTFDQVDADRIAQSLNTLTKSFDGVPEALPDALLNLRSLSAVITERRDQMRSLLRNTNTVTSMIRGQKANLGSLILQGRDLIGDLADRRAALQQLFASATALVGTLNRVLGDQPGLDQLLASLRDLASMIATHDGQFRSLMQALPITMRNIANATGSGTGADVTLSAGPLVDSWMCAISGRAEQFHLTEYFKDCQ